MCSCEFILTNNENIDNPVITNNDFLSLSKSRCSLFHTVLNSKFQSLEQGS